MKKTYDDSTNFYFIRQNYIAFITKKRLQKLHIYELYIIQIHKKLYNYY